MISATLSRRLALLSFIASALGLAGCGGGGGGGSGTAQMRTLNLTTDLAAVDAAGLDRAATTQPLELTVSLGFNGAEERLRLQRRLQCTPAGDCGGRP